jgi:hypothetical protein
LEGAIHVATTYPRVFIALRGKRISAGGEDR